MKEVLKYFDPEPTPKFWHVGLRTIKTVLSVFICALIGYARGQTGLFSMVAAVSSVQNTPGSTLISALNQTLGTVIGGIIAVGVVYFGSWAGLFDNIPLYYLLVSLMLIPTIMLTLLIKKPSIAAFSCVVFIWVAVAIGPGINPVSSAVQRLLDTFIGIVVAFLTNLIIPKHRKGIQELGEKNNRKSGSPAKKNQRHTRRRHKK